MDHGIEEGRERKAVVGQKGGLDGTMEQFLHPSPSLGLTFPGHSPLLPPSLQAPGPSTRLSWGVGSPATATASSWSHQARAPEAVCALCPEISGSLGEQG